MQHGIFSLAQAMRGYRLNMMCHTLNRADNRAAFVADEAGFCREHGLDAVETEAVLARDKARLHELGGNMYYLAKLDRVKRAEAN
jgi:protocatechuate 4,5-dioxygenase alpha chain